MPDNQYIPLWGNISNWWKEMYQSYTTPSEPAKKDYASPVATKDYIPGAGSTFAQLGGYEPMTGNTGFVWISKGVPVGSDLTPIDLPAYENPYNVPANAGFPTSYDIIVGGKKTGTKQATQEQIIEMGRPDVQGMDTYGKELRQFYQDQWIIKQMAGTYWK